MDNKRIGELRSLVSVMLIVAAAVVGVVAYIGLSLTERHKALFRFTSTVDAAVSKLDDNFQNMDNSLRLMAQMYVQLHPLEDWPNVVLPNFETSGTLAREIGKTDTVALAVHVKPEDVSSYESFMFNEWDKDPNTYSAGYFSSTQRGLFAVNDSSDGLFSSPPILYHDTTGRTTWGEGRNILALAQVLLIDDTPQFQIPLGSDTNLAIVNFQRSVPIVVGNKTHHEFVGLVGTQYSWGPTLSRIFAESVSGIDIVVRYGGSTFTCRIKEGMAEILGGSEVVGYGDLASKRFAEYKVYVPNALKNSQFKLENDNQHNLEMTFYPTAQFIDDYTTSLPTLVACCGVLLIVLVSMVFVGYDVAVRGAAASREIVLDTKRRFVRFVSHEIRTPMNAVRLGMTLFSSEIDSLVGKMDGKSLEEVMVLLRETLADWRQIAVDVLENSEAAVDVLNDLLNYDKIESGSLRLEFSMVPVLEVLQRTFKTFVLQAREKDIVFQLQGEMFDADASLQGDLGTMSCLGDATRIAQVLRNLISNSLKFTGTRGTVTVTAEYEINGLENAIIQQAPRLLLANPRAGAVRITVKDDGAGLSPAQVGDICQEGVQFNANTLQAGGGSGLGLFIGKGIVEQLGGTMRVSSEGLGKGATFVIELPLFKIDETEGLGSPSMSYKGQQEDEVMPLFPLVPLNKCLLVVDDAISNRKLLVRILKNKGYLCSEAADGQQALDVYQQMIADGTPPCAILMDYEMPVMNGPTATKSLRAMGCGSYIVGVTGNVMQADIDVFIQHGANAVLAKPLRVETFESMMASLFIKQKSPGPSRRDFTKAQSFPSPNKTLQSPSPNNRATVGGVGVGGVSGGGIGGGRRGSSWRAAGVGGSMGGGRGGGGGKVYIDNTDNV